MPILSQVRRRFRAFRCAASLALRSASAAPNDDADPVSTTTPASTGALHAETIPENSPRP
jgi:hypothetical protein